MKNSKHKQHKTIILNGTNVWMAAIAFLIIHGGAGIWWASKLDANFKNLKEEVVEIKQDVKTLKIEATHHHNDTWDQNLKA